MRSAPFIFSKVISSIMSEGISSEYPIILSGHDRYWTISHPTIWISIYFIDFLKDSIMCKPVVAVQENYNFVIIGTVNRII